MVEGVRKQAHGQARWIARGAQLTVKFREKRFGFRSWDHGLLCILATRNVLAVATSLPDVEHEPKWVFKVATRTGGILFLNSATSSYQFSFSLLNIRHQELEYRPMGLTLFNVQAKGTSFKT